MVSFNCVSNDGVAELARKHEARLPGGTCTWFLRELGRRTGDNPGSKGGLSLWGHVGKSIDVRAFVYDLSDFWSELLASDLDGGPFFTEHIIIIYEHEQTWSAKCFEIGLPAEMQDYVSSFHERMGRGPDSSKAGEALPGLAIKHHDLPFAWML